MSFHVPNKHRVKNGQYGSEDSIGNYGAFLIPFDSFELVTLASEGLGWEHVSVSLKNRCPNWKEMCFIKDTFWDEDDVVMQLHPKKSEYINFHPNCLHLWRPTNKVIPTPPKDLVGPVKK